MNIVVVFKKRYFRKINTDINFLLIVSNGLADNANDSGIMSFHAKQKCIAATGGNSVDSNINW